MRHLVLFQSFALGVGTFLTNGRQAIPPCELWLRGPPEAPGTTQAAAIALGCPPELDGKIPLLKPSHTGDREVTLVLALKLLAGLHNITRYCAGFWEIKVLASLTQM